MAAPSASASSPQVQAEIAMLLNGPAGKPPSGVVPEFQHPPNLDAVFIATTTLCATVAFLAVTIRLYTKQYLMRSRAYEDYVIVSALIGEITFIVTSTYILKSGGGIHMWDLRLKDFFRVLYWLNISSMIYGIVIFLIKLSILLQYIGIFVPTRKGNMALFVAIHIVIWSLFVFYLANTIFEIVLCQPREKIWNLLITNGHCFDINAPPMATGVFNIISDFAILVLPIAPIWKLQMAVRKKTMIAAIFATGIVHTYSPHLVPSACATSVLRTVYTWKIVQNSDVSYNIFRMGLWTVAEMATGILVSCLPVMPRFFQHFGLKISSTLSHGSKSLSKRGQESVSNNVTSQRRFPLWYKRSGNMSGTGGSDTLVGEHDTQAEGQREYIMLGNFEMPKLRNKELPELPDVLAYGRGTRREDIETGMFAA